MLAADVLRLVSGALQDLEPGMNSRWPWEDDDPKRITLIHFLNSAIQAVCLQRPDVTAVTEPILLELGMRQTIPSKKKHRSTADAAMLVELIRNMGHNGETPGPPISLVNGNVLLAWGRHACPASIVENYAYDRSLNPKIYYVYPPVAPSAGIWVEATYSAAPQHVHTCHDHLPISDVYAPALMHHILSSILAGDSEHSNLVKAQYHAQMFQSVLGIKAQVDIAWPKTNLSLRGATK